MLAKSIARSPTVSSTKTAQSFPFSISWSTSVQEICCGTHIFIICCEKSVSKAINNDRGSCKRVHCQSGERHLALYRSVFVNAINYITEDFCSGFVDMLLSSKAWLIFSTFYKKKHKKSDMAIGVTAISCCPSFMRNSVNGSQWYFSSFFSRRCRYNMAVIIISESSLAAWFFSFKNCVGFSTKNCATWLRVLSGNFTGRISAPGLRLFPVRWSILLEFVKLYR